MSVTRRYCIEMAAWIELNSPMLLHCF